MIEKPYSVMLIVPRDSEGDLGRQLLQATSPSSVTNNNEALMRVSDGFFRLMRKHFLNELVTSSNVRSFFSGPELAIASITYFPNLGNRSAFAGVFSNGPEMFCHHNAIVRRQ